MSEQSGERRRPIVSNEVIAERLDALRTNMNQSFGALQLSVEKDVRALVLGMDKLDTRLNSIDTAVTRIDERVKAVEAYKDQQEKADAEARTRAATQLSAAQDGAYDAKTYRVLAAVAATVLTLLIAAITAYAAFHG